MVKEGERFCTNGKVISGEKGEMIGKSMTSEGQIFSHQEMSIAIKKLKENKAADEKKLNENKAANEKKSKIGCIHGEFGRRNWMMGDCCIGKVK